MHVRFWAGVAQCVLLSCGISRAAIGVALCCLDPAAVCMLNCLCYLMCIVSAIVDSITTFSDGCLGLDNDEGRSEV